MFKPSDHPDWLRPHSFEWYAQLGRLTGQYAYSWQSTIAEPNGERIFEQEVGAMVPGQKVLDIGCGHGDFTMKWSSSAKEIVGIDVTSGFLKRGSQGERRNVSFLAVNTKEGLPFADAEFDCAYTRRGPTSAYLDLKRIVRQGGKIIGLHPGDDASPQLSDWFPGFFTRPPAGTPIRDHVECRLLQGGLNNVEIETITSIEYLHEPIDVLKMSLFGQTPALMEHAIETAMDAIRRAFEMHASSQGLPVSFVRYIVRGSV